MGVAVLVGTRKGAFVLTADEAVSSKVYLAGALSCVKPGNK